MKMFMQYRTQLKNIFFTGYLFIWIVIGCFLSFYFIYLKPKKLDWFLQYWSIKALKNCGISVTLTGKENIPHQGSILLFNHTSLLDILVLQACVGSHISLRFGAKTELFRIPIFSSFMKKIGTLPITRGDAKKTQNVYLESISKVHGGQSIALAPEGGRSDGIEMKKFKSGPFAFAIQAQAPLLPIVIHGNKNILPKKSLLLNLKSPQIKISILPATSTKDKEMKDRHELKEKIRRQFIEELLPYSKQPRDKSSHLDLFLLI